MIIHFFCAASIVALVLLQRGKGAEAGAGFGAGASGTVFGARGASTALSRATAILAAIFMVTSLSLAYVGTRKAATPSSGVLEQFAQPAAPAKGTPGAPPATVTLPAPAPAAGAAAPTSTLPAQSAPPAAATHSAPAAQSAPPATTPTAPANPTAPK
ncbi:MAG TPA: preprotein translocase subunit SecG [Steroidobacteraceae bacterium]|nr:preprotein translocase subunit SecG [Steroidobacteraceae bacterium]